MLNNKLKSSYTVLVLIIFFVTYLISIKNLSPTSINWLLYDETAQSYIGWAFFRQSDLLQWPLFLNNVDGISVNSSIAYSASNPLISIPLKYVLYPFQEIHIQFHSIWIIIIFLLQYLTFRKILLHYYISGYILEVSSILVIVQPFWLFRLRLGHIDGMAHFLILAAIYGYIKKAGSKYWLLIIIISAAIHPYLNVMVFSIYLLSLVTSQDKSKYIKFKSFLVVTFSNVISLIFSGFLDLNNTKVSMGGYGLFKTNLNSFVDSGVDLGDGLKHQYSFLIPDLAQNIGDYEGYSFLGLGIFIALAVVLLNFRRIEIDRTAFLSKNFVYLFLFAVCLYILSLSNNFDFGKTRLFTLPNIPLVSTFFEYFRVSARFSWPLIYLCLIIVLVTYNKIQAKKIVLELGITLILVIQVIDTLPLISEIHNTYNNRSSWDTKLNLTNWNSVIQKNKIDRIIMVNPVNNPVLNIDISKLALDNDIKVNFGYFARVDQRIIERQYRMFSLVLINGVLDKQSIYLLKGEDQIHAFQSGIKPKCTSFFREKDYLVVYYSRCAKSE